MYLAYLAPGMWYTYITRSLVTSYLLYGDLLEYITGTFFFKASSDTVWRARYAGIYSQLCIGFPADMILNAVIAVGSARQGQFSQTESQKVYVQDFSCYKKLTALYQFLYPLPWIDYDDPSTTQV